VANSVDRRQATFNLLATGVERAGCLRQTKSRLVAVSTARKLRRNRHSNSDYCPLQIASLPRFKLSLVSLQYHNRERSQPPITAVAIHSLLSKNVRNFDIESAHVQPFALDPKHVIWHTKIVVLVTRAAYIQ
jgi:hypothetical protein